MKQIMAATLLFSTLGAGVVLAQTTTSPSATTAPGVTTGAATTTPPSTMPPAVTTKDANTTAAAPVAGANSYTQVSTLAKDDKSIWRGHAMKSGKAVDVALDYQGNVTAN